MLGPRPGSRFGSRFRALLTLSAMVLSACGVTVEDHIARLKEGGEGAEDAKMALSLARQDAIDPLIAAFVDETSGADARVHMADALGRLFLREKDPDILTTLHEGLNDASPEVRSSIIRVLGDMGGQRGVPPLLERLTRESDDAVRRDLLVTLGVMSLQLPRGGNNTGFFRTWSLDVMADSLQGPFVESLLDMRDDAQGSTRTAVMEWLEVAAEAYATTGLERELAADLIGARQLLEKGRDLVPDSRNMNRHLGRFEFDNEDADKGLVTMANVGAALRVPELSAAPVIDGHLDESLWQQATRLDSFYQNISRMRAYLIDGRTAIYLGYRGPNLYIGVKGWEPETGNLQAGATNRDENAWQDDCVELFFDPDRDRRTFWQIVINSTNTVFDQHSDGTGPQGNTGWNGEFDSATHVAEDYWSVEVAIPMAQFGEGETGAGAVWGANLARIRIANASEYGQWVPTYGSALRPDRFGYLVFE